MPWPPRHHGPWDEPFPNAHHRVASWPARALVVDSAALYQALHRLERKKLVQSSWGMSETNRRAKFYELTPLGRTHLRAQRKQLRAYIDALALVLDPL